jgi:flagellar basal-body rod protein FlgC
MDLVKAMDIAATGMRAQGTRMRVISENVANATTTAKTPEGEPYRRQMVTFKNELNRANDTVEVKIDKIVADPKAEFVMKYDPSHPAADDKGYVKMPNVNPLIEMADMREAQRTYEANLGVIDVSKTMLMGTIDLIRSGQ